MPSAGAGGTQPPDVVNLEQEGGVPASAGMMHTPAAAASGTDAALVAAPWAELRSEMASAAALQAGLACLKASPAVSPALSPLLMPAWHGLAAGMKDFTLSMPDLCARGAQRWASPGFGSPEVGGLSALQGGPPVSLWPGQRMGQQPWQGFEGPWQGLDVPSPETPEGKAALGGGTASSARSDAAGACAGAEPATVFGSPGLPDMGARTPGSTPYAAWLHDGYCIKHAWRMRESCGSNVPLLERLHTAYVVAVEVMHARGIYSNKCQLGREGALVHATSFDRKHV